MAITMGCHFVFFFFQAEDGIRDKLVTGVQTCALPIFHRAYAIGADPTDAYIELHDVAVEAYQRIVDVLHDGATVADVLDAAEMIHERGFTIFDDLLHGTGQLPPIIQTRRTKRGDWTEDFVFREDMVVVVQPNVVNDSTGRLGLQVGETVRITKTGIQRLHDYPMRFIRIG